MTADVSLFVVRQSGALIASVKCSASAHERIRSERLFQRQCACRRKPPACRALCAIGMLANNEMDLCMTMRSLIDSCSRTLDSGADGREETAMATPLRPSACSKGARRHQCLQRSTFKVMFRRQPIDLQESRMRQAAARFRIAASAAGSDAYGAAYGNA
jgi:hypothetical protein